MNKNYPKKPKDCNEWIFTFGYGHAHPNKYVTYTGTFDEARSKMFKDYGAEWAFQHPITKAKDIQKSGIMPLEGEK